MYVFCGEHRMISLVYSLKDCLLSALAYRKERDTEFSSVFFLYTIKPPDSLGVKKSLSGEIMKKILLASIMRMWSAKSQKQEETRRKMS